MKYMIYFIKKFYDLCKHGTFFKNLYSSMVIVINLQTLIVAVVLYNLNNFCMKQLYNDLDGSRYKSSRVFIRKEVYTN